MNEEHQKPEINEVALEADNKITINFDELKPNSVIVLKINPTGMQQRIAATQQIALALRPFNQLAKSKNIVFIVMGSGEDMSVLEEEQMNSMGWFKQEQSRIIKPFSHQ